MFGEHPIVAPMVAAFILGVFGIIEASQGAWVAFVLSYVDAIGMTAIAAHSRVARGGQ